MVLFSVLLGVFEVVIGCTFVCVYVCVYGFFLVFFGGCIAVFVFIGVLFVEADDHVNTR